MRNSSVALLHPAMRVRVEDLIGRLAAEKIPLAPYETARTPFRQADLYARGRTVPGTKRVTKARAWESLHQYAIAVDFVFLINGGWTWDEPEKGMWGRYAGMARDVGLDQLSFETPHVQLPWSLDDLKAGRLPPGPDGEWSYWLAQQAEQWGAMARVIGDIVHPGAPLFDSDLDARPELSENSSPVV